MGRLSGIYTLIFWIISGSAFFAQNEATKWYFGSFSGLDFMTSPPTLLTNGAMSTQEGCASIANSAGNLLFYTDGVTVWNQQHLIMSNGNGLHGSYNSSQSGVIVKQPGNATIYYIFTVDALGGANGLKYSVVDMSQAGGLGAVTIKNVPLFTPSSEKITGIRHCNGVDVWVVTHGWNNNVFNAYLLTSGGLSAPVSSAVGTLHTGWAAMIGQMKSSPNGKRIGLGLWSPIHKFELYDFDNSNGAVSNPLILGTYTDAYGVEFSPDGTKFYGTRDQGNEVYQWDLCAGTGTAVIASVYSVAATYVTGMQLAPNGKIYVSRYLQQSIGVIDNPNVQGAGCSYANTGQSLAPRMAQYSFPNFVSSYFKTPPPPFTYTVTPAISCVTATFTAPPAISFTGCAALAYSVTGLSWSFGDPASGPSNYSGLDAPVHVYSGPGTFTTQLVINYSCGGGGDTLRQAVFIPGYPTVSVAGTSVCPQQTGTLTALGAAAYTWQPGAVTGSVFVQSPAATSVYTVTGSVNGCMGTATAAIVVWPAPLLSFSSSPITCASPGSATAAATGGMGPYTYTWLPAAQISSVATNLVPGSYTLLAFDAGAGCHYDSVVTFISPVTFTGNVSATASLACSGSATGTAAIVNLSGGSGSQTYVWQVPAGILTTPTVGALPAGVYTVQVSDGLSFCSFSHTFEVAEPPPLSLTISAGSATACAGSIVLLTASASGGSGPAYTYTWSAGAFNPVYAVAEPLPGSYVYTASAGDGSTCVTSTTVGITFVASPTLTVSDVSVCPQQPGTLVVSGAAGYTWQPSGFVGSAFTDAPNATTHYTVTGSMAGCLSAPATASIILKPVPVATIAASWPLCMGDTLHLSTGTASAYAWSGPAAFGSSVQHPVLPAVGLSHSGQYSLTVTAVNGCTAAAQQTVAVLPVPSLSLGTQPVCVNQPLLLTAGAIPGSFMWSGPDQFTSTLQNPVLHPAALSMNGAYTLTVTTAAGCRASASIAATVVPLPVPAILSGTKLCAGSFLSLKGSGGGSYEWAGPNSISATGSNLLILAENAGFSGTYTLTVSNASGCRASVARLITVYPKPEAGFKYEPLQPLEGDDRVEFINQSVGEALSAEWFFIDNDGYVSTDWNTAYLFEQAGVYPVSLVVKNAWGCADTMVRAIAIGSDVNLYLPNSFTPNQDSRNEVFRAKGTGIATFHLEVFDRWGEKLFDATDIRQGWDGSYKGSPCKEDTYVWKASATDVNGKSRQLSGHVTLYR